MDREINVVTDKATIIKGDGWNSITAVDFGGIDIEWTNELSGNTTITAITNGNIFANTSNMFRGMTKLSVLEVNLDNVSAGIYMCQGDSRLKSFEIDMPNVTTLGGAFNACTSLQKLVSYVPKLNYVGTMLYECTSLSYLDLVVNNSHSDWDINSFGLNFFGAPCTAHRYCFSRNDDNVRLVFTADDWGDAGNYNQIDCTDDDRVETITADTIIVLSDGGSYIADPPAGPPENPHKAINITVIVDGIYVTTTPSILSRGKFTWSTTEKAGYTKWQDKLWYKYSPLGHIAVTTKYDVPISLPNRQVGDYYTADFRLDATTTDAEGNGNIVINGTTSRQEWRLCRWYDGQSYYNIGGSMNSQAKQYLPDGERITRTLGNNYIKDENGEILWEGTPQTNINFLDFAVRFCKVSIWDFKYYSKDGTLLMHLIPDSLGGFKDDVTGIVYGEGLANLQFVED